MAVNINVTEDENSIDINDVNVFTIHVKDLSVPGSIQVQEDVSEISEDTVDTSTEVRVIELSIDPTVEVSINEINTNTVTITTTDTNVIEVSDDIAIVTAATEAASRKLRGFTGDSIWDQFGDNAAYTEGNVGIGTNSPNHKLDVAGNVNAASFTGTFVGVISSSAQIAADISGAFADLSNTVTTNQGNISTRQNETAVNAANIATNQSNIANAASRLSAIEIMTGSLSQSVVNNAANIAGNLIQINNQIEVSASLQSRLTNVEAGSTSKTLLSGSAQIASEISGAFTTVSESLQTRLTSAETELSNALISGSLQIASEISGAFTAASESIQSRLSAVEAGSTSKTLLSGSAQIATEISGAFTTVSESLQDRLTNVEAGSTSKTLLSGSAQIATEISGAFTAASASLQSRISVVEIASSSFSTRVTDLEDTTADKTFNHITASGNISASGAGPHHLSGSLKVKTGNTTITLGPISNGAFSDISTNTGTLFLQQNGGSLVQVGTDLLPSATLTKDLGSPTRLWNNLYVNNISASGAITASTIRSDSDMQIGGDLSVQGAVFSLTGFGITIDDISVTTGSTQFGSSSLDTHEFTGSMSISGSLSVKDSLTANSFAGTFVGALSSSAQIASEISGAFVATSSSLASRLTSAETELSNTLISGSAQIASAISGAFGETSSSIQSRLNVVESKLPELENTLISGSAQIASEISGAFGETSHSLQNRLTAAETELGNTLISGSAQIATEISGAFTAASESIQSRLNIIESDLGTTLISSSAQIASEISGAFSGIGLISSSAQIASEISGAFSGIGLISSSAQISADISGAFNNIDFDPGLDTGVVVYDSNTKRLYYTGSYNNASAATSGTTSGTTQYATSSTATAVDLTKLIINDFSDEVSVTTNGGILELTFGTPINPYFSSFNLVGFDSNRFNKEIDNYKLDINFELNGNTFVKGELSASTAGAASVGVTTFNIGDDIDINSTFPSYQSGSHVFTVKAFTILANGSEFIAQESVNATLNKTNPQDPSIVFTNYNITKNAYNESDMEIEEGAIGNITFNLNEGDARGWTAADIHNSEFNTTLTVNASDNVTTGEIEEYWNSGTDNDPQRYYTGSAQRTFTRVRSLRYKSDVNGSIPSENELLNLNNWPGTIEAGVNDANEIEGIVMEFVPEDTINGEFVFIVYDADLGNLSSIKNAELGYEEISTFEETTIGTKYKLYKKSYVMSFPTTYKVEF